MRVLAERETFPRLAASRWSDLRTRLISAAILGPLVLLCIWLAGVPYALMLLGASLGLGWEWVALCGAAAPGLPGLLVLVSLATGVSCAMLGQPLAGLVVLVAGTILTAAAARTMSHGRALAAGVPYIGVGIVALLWLRDDRAVGLANLLFLLLLVWASDVGAYLTGRIVGGPRLAPAISPGKTWSGSAGGLAAAVVMALVVAAPPAETASVGRIAGIAVGLGVVSQAGDLLESLIKRHFGVKDSSRIIPGHGGLLDRLDALLVAAPVAALLALLAGRGVRIWQ